MLASNTAPTEITFDMQEGRATALQYPLLPDDANTVIPLDTAEAAAWAREGDAVSQA
jgi:hypothetical protein